MNNKSEKECPHTEIYSRLGTLEQSVAKLIEGKDIFRWIIGVVAIAGCAAFITSASKWYDVSAKISSMETKLDIVMEKK